jgi:hypothetical protein
MWIRTHVAREAGVTVRANYVALPFAAGRGQDEGGEIPPDQGAPRPSCPGRTVLTPKIAANGAPQGDALPFRTGSETPPLRLAALHPLMGRGARLKKQPARCAGAMTRAQMKWLFEN